MELYVVRHGQIPSNIEGIISCWNDEALTEEGIRQANAMRDSLNDISFDVLYSSPVPRAIQTAKIIIPNGDFILDDRLAEREPGELLGKPRKDVDKAMWNSLEVHRTPEGAETLLSGLERVRSFLDEIHSKYKDKTILIVTHNFISKCIWILENDISDKDEINNFLHKNGDIKYYKK